MGDWDDEESTPKLVANAWEDEEEDVPDAWDVEEKPKEEAKPVVVAKKLTAKERINQKEEKRQQIIADLKKKDNEPDSRELTELEREQMNRDQECTIIIDAFGEPDAPAVLKSGFDFGNPSTKQDFINLGKKLGDQFKKLETSPHYSKFAEDFIREISLEIELDNLRDLSTAISALVSEKQKLTKPKSKKKVGKAKLIVERENDFSYNDDDQQGGDEYDDFL